MQDSMRNAQIREPFRIPPCILQSIKSSCLALVDVERSYSPFLGLRQLDCAKSVFVPYDVVFQGHEQTLGVLGSKDNARLNRCLGHTRQYAGEIEHEV